MGGWIYKSAETYATSCLVFSFFLFVVMIFSIISTIKRKWKLIAISLILLTGGIFIDWLICSAEKPFWE